MIAPLARKTILFAGGGTGGHLFPALALARSLPGLPCAFLVPDDRGDVERMRGEFPCIPSPCPRPDKGRLLYPARLLRAVLKARRLLRGLRACGVVGLGGYASVPAVLAARSLRLPVYLMECNAVPGKATRALARFASGIGLGTETALGAMRRRAACRVTGTPLREELHLRGDPREFGLEPGRPTLLVLGGSQGSSALNRRVLEGLEGCGDLSMQVLLAAGSADADRARSEAARSPVPVRVFDFLAEVGRAYSVADLVLARGGAATVAECLALGLPAIYVPYPHHRDRQQARNAEDAVRAGAAELLEETDLSPQRFRASMQRLLVGEGDARRRMAEQARRIARPAAASAMAEHLLECLGEAAAEARWLAEIGG